MHSVFKPPPCTLAEEIPRNIYLLYDSRLNFENGSQRNVVGINSVSQLDFTVKKPWDFFFFLFSGMKFVTVVRNWVLPCSIRKKYIICALLVLFTLDYFGVFTHLFEIELDKNFRYPYDGDVTEYVVRIRQGLKPAMAPINYYNYSVMSNAAEKCGEGLKLVYLVKSAMENFERRRAIRSTWGFEKRFSDVAIRTFFVVGVSEDRKVQASIEEECKRHKDIIQLNFIDSYYNNTIKTMSAFKWAVEHCLDSRFYFFSDDDMFISTKNVLLFLRHPTRYPEYLQLPENLEVNDESTMKTHILKEKKAKHIYNMELPANAMLYAGYVFVSSPHRHKSSKWFVSLREYPYNYWPPYVTAGSYVLSKEALIKMYYTSLYTKHFRFDDIYLGLVALKAGIEPLHCDEFHFYKKKYNPFNYKYVISSHGYENPKELIKVWNEQKSRGYA